MSACWYSLLTSGSTPSQLAYATPLDSMTSVSSSSASSSAASTDRPGRRATRPALSPMPLSAHALSSSSCLRRVARCRCFSASVLAASAALTLALIVLASAAHCPSPAGGRPAISRARRRGCRVAIMVTPCLDSTSRSPSAFWAASLQLDLRAVKRASSCCIISASSAHSRSARTSWPSSDQLPSCSSAAAAPPELPDPVAAAEEARRPVSWLHWEGVKWRSSSTRERVLPSSTRDM
mmetsp:Transcript_27732/g.60751  ORF Transcript_27732/g.60751 Transcript_27732/m.60751 type:complete len:237 (-) Transcript_27732:1558-2268(-)